MPIADRVRAELRDVLTDAAEIPDEPHPALTADLTARRAADRRPAVERVERDFLGRPDHRGRADRVRLQADPGRAAALGLPDRHPRPARGGGVRGVRGRRLRRACR